MRLLAIIGRKDGKATDARITKIATTTIISTNVNPETRRIFTSRL
jgi:hypothetical protein